MDWNLKTRRKRGTDPRPDGEIGSQPGAPEGYPGNKPFRLTASHSRFPSLLLTPSSLLLSAYDGQFCHTPPTGFVGSGKRVSTATTKKPTTCWKRLAGDGAAPLLPHHGNLLLLAPK